MKVIQTLVYNYATEILGNLPTSYLYPEHIRSLRDTTKCPYCGTALTKIYREVVEKPEYVWRRDECTACGWWSAYEHPQYTNGYNLIGVLQKRSRIDGELSSGLEAIVDRIQQIYEMPPTRFEHFIAGLLREFYDCEVVHVGKSHDGGIDLILLDSNDGKIPIQVKRRQSKETVEPVSLVREFRGAMLLKGHDRGIIVTTAGSFSRAAVSISEPRSEHTVPQWIDLIDCRRLLDIMGLIVESARAESAPKYLVMKKPPDQIVHSIESATGHLFVVTDMDDWLIEPKQTKELEVGLGVAYRPEVGMSVGIDVGPTNIKIVVLAQGKVPQFQTFPTWGADEDSIDSLLTRVMKYADAALHQLPVEANSIGIAWSTLVRPDDGVLLPTRHWWSKTPEEMAKIYSLKTMLGTKYPLMHIEVQKDGNMDAFAILVTEQINDTAIIDVGTDITGGYISKQGQVGFHIPMELGGLKLNFSTKESYSPWLPAGCFNDLSSMKAIQRLCANKGVKLDAEPKKLAPLGRESSNTRAIRLEVAEGLAEGCGVLLRTMRCQRIRLCGGVFAAEWASALVEEAASILTTQYGYEPVDIKVSSCNPTFCGALGAAHFANARSQVKRNFLFGMMGIEI